MGDSMASRSQVWRRMPPAVFPAIFGFLGLGLAWRRAEAAYQLPVPIGEMLLGAGIAILAVAVLACLAKLLLRAGTLREDLRTLPGRAGMAAMTLSLMLAAVALAPYAPAAATALVVAALIGHAALAALVAHVIATGPEEGRVVTPVWHLVFVGFIVGAVALIALDRLEAARAILYATMPVAGVILAVSLWQLARGLLPPAPLRPLLAVHLAPASLFATVSGMLGLEVLAAVWAALGGVMLVGLLLAARWLLAAGFTPLWGALTFPPAAYSSVLILASDGAGAPGVVAGVMLVGTTLLVVPVLALLLRGWARGELAAKTNAARV